MNNIFGNIVATINNQGSNMTPKTAESKKGDLNMAKIEELAKKHAEQMMTAPHNYSVNPLDDMDDDEVTEVMNKEDMGMKALETIINNAAVEEVVEMENNVTVVALDAAKIWIQLDVEKTSDPDYLRKDVLAGILNSNFGKNYTKNSLKKIKREVLVEELRAELAEYLNDEEPNDGTPDEVEIPGAADGFCEEEPVIEAQAVVVPTVEEMVKKYTSKDEVHNIIFGVDRGGRHINGIAHYAHKYGKDIYISEHMLTSVIAEEITGKPLKNAKTGEVSTYSQYEIDVIKGVRAYLVANISRFTTMKDGAVTGYYLNAYTTAKINPNKGLKYWFRYTDESAAKMGKKGETYILRKGKLYMGKKCVVENMQWADYCKLDKTCSFWEFC